MLGTQVNTGLRKRSVSATTVENFFEETGLLSQKSGMVSFLSWILVPTCSNFVAWTDVGFPCQNV